MKKLFLFVAVTALTAGTLVSCGKTSKGKLDAEWTINTMEESKLQSGGNSNTLKIQGSTITDTDVIAGSTTTVSGTVNEAKWTISKDGTWSRVVSVKFVQENTNVTTVGTTKESGNWDFFSGIGELEKNERIVFNTLSTTETVVTTSGSSTSTDIDAFTYKDGENSEIYTITESKKGMLKMEFNGAKSVVNTSGTTTTSSTVTTKKSFSMTSN